QNRNFAEALEVAASDAGLLSRQHLHHGKAGTRIPYSAIVRRSRVERRLIADGSEDAMADRDSRRRTTPAPLFGRDAVPRNDVKHGGYKRWTAAVVGILAATGAFYWSELHQEE